METHNKNTSRVHGLCRDFPPGCGTSSSSLKSLKSVHTYVRDFPPGCGSNGEKTAQNVQQKRLASEKNTGSSGDSSKSKVLSVVCGAKNEKPQERMKGKEETMVVTVERKKVLEMLMLFRERYKKISSDCRGIKRIDVEAKNELDREGKLTYHPGLMIGPVPGVEIGDKFYYRIELVVVGLHRRFQGGIDFMDYGRGKVATCIVANEGHLDKMSDPNVLTYVGEGGTLKRNQVGPVPDQKLKMGNLALHNSMVDKKVVRVVRGLKSESCRGQKILYVYDGLYEVRSCEKKKGPQGNMIFEFQLTRCPGQPAVAWKSCRWF